MLISEKMLARRFMIALSAVAVILLLATPLMALEPTDKWEGTLDYAATGGSFLQDTCQPSLTGCVPGMFDGQGDIVNSTSKATLYGVPDGVHIVKAYLIWMGSLQHGAMEPDNQVNIEPPLGNTYPVVADDSQLEEITYQDTDANGNMGWYHFFTYRADVTEIIRRHVITDDKPLNGQYTITGFTGYVGEPYLSRTTGLGGWSLIVAYSGAFMQPKKIYYYTDFRNIHDSVVTLNPIGFEIPEDPEAKVTFFLGEGDQGIAGQGMTGTHNEELKFNGMTLTDICNSNNNAYNSTINTNIRPNEQPCRINQYSVDLDTFDISHLLAPGDTEAEVLLSLGQDQAFTNYLILSIDTKLPDFDIPNEPEKTASVASGHSLYPGQEFTYYIFVENNGEDSATNVRVRDPLPPDVVYIPGSTVVVEPSGERREIPDLSGDVSPIISGIDIADVMETGPAHRHTVEIGVRLGTLDEGVNKETIVTNTAEIISGNGDVYFTNGGVPVQHTVQLEAFEGTLHFSNGKHHPGKRFVASGDTGVPIAHINLKSIGGTVQLSSFRFTPSEDSVDVIIDKLRLAVDADNNGILGAADLPLGGAASWSGNGYVFDDFSSLPEIVANGQANLMLVADISSDPEVALPGAETLLELTEEGVSVRGFTEGLPFETASVIIPGADTDLSMQLGYANPGEGYIASGSTSTVMQLQLHAYSAGVTVDSLALSSEGTVHDPTEVSQVYLYSDPNGDGFHQPGEPQMGAAASFADNDGSISFSGFSFSIDEGEDANLILVAMFDASISKDKRFRLRINNNDQLGSGGAVVEGAPVVGSLFTFSEGEVIECTNDEQCRESIGPGWICDQLAGICISSGPMPDGDTPVTDGDTVDGDNEWRPDGDSGNGEDDEDGSGGGCNHTGSSCALFLLGLAAMAVLFVRKRSKRS